MGKRQKPLTNKTQCDWCELARNCRSKEEHQKRVFFRLARGEQETCQQHEPRWYRGIKGVVA